MLRKHCLSIFIQHSGKRFQDRGHPGKPGAADRSAQGLAHGGRNRLKLDHEPVTELPTAWGGGGAGQ